MHSSRAPAGLLRRTEARGLPTSFYKGLVTVVGGETTQSQHTDLPVHVKLSKLALLQGRNEDLSPNFSDCELDRASYEYPLAPRIPHTESVSSGNLASVQELAQQDTCERRQNRTRKLGSNFASMHPLRCSAGVVTKRNAMASSIRKAFSGHLVARSLLTTWLFPFF